MYKKYKSFFWISGIVLIVIVVLIPSFQYRIVENIFCECFWLQNFIIDSLELIKNDFLIHLIFCIIHITNVILVYFIAQKIFKNIEISVVSSLLFGIHPIVLDSVISLTQSIPVFYTFFALLSIFMYLKYIEGSKIWFLGFSLLFFIIGVLLNISIAITILIFFLIDYARDKTIFSKQQLINKLGFLLIAIVAFMVFIFNKHQAHNYSVIEYGFLYSSSLFSYLWRIINPYDLTSVLPFPKIDLLQYLSFVGFMVLIIVSFIFRKKSKGIFISIYIYLILQTAFLFIHNSGVEMLANACLYYSSIGVFFLIGCIYYLSTTKKWMHIIAGSILALYVIFILTVSLNQSIEYKSKEVSLEQIINKYPDSSIGLQLRGANNKRLGNLAEAISDYNLALQRDTFNTNIYLQRGLVLLQVSKYNNALRDFSYAINFDTTNAEAWLQSGIALNKIGKFPQSIYAINKAISYKASKTKAYTNLGDSYLGLQKTDTALLYYDKAIAKNDDNLKAYMKRGNLKLNSLNDNSGMKDLNYVLEKNPENIETLFLKANALIKNNKLKDAILIFSQILTYDSQNAMAAYERGNCKLKLANNQGAIIDYTLAIEINSNYLNAFINRGTAYFNLKDYVYAIRDFTIAIKLSPTSVDGYYNRGIAEYYSEQYIEAAQDFSIALGLDMKFIAAYYYRGMSYIKQNRTKLGCRDLQVAEKVGIPEAEQAYNEYCN